MIKNILSYFRYLPHAKKRYGVMGALTIVGTPAAVQRGIELGETGIVCRRVAVRYFAEVNDRLEGITGEATLRAISAKFSRDITVEGEVAGATGIMAFNLAVALTFANDMATFGDGTGKILLDEATETQERSGWRSVSVRASSNPMLP
jgi:hypothetical protein